MTNCSLEACYICNIPMKGELNVMSHSTIVLAHATEGNTICMDDMIRVTWQNPTVLYPPITVLVDLNVLKPQNHESDIFIIKEQTVIKEEFLYRSLQDV